MGSLEEPQIGILHFGVPDNSITADQRGFFAFPSYKAVKKVMKFNARFTQNTPGEVNLAEYSAENQCVLTVPPPRTLFSPISS